MVLKSIYYQKEKRNLFLCNPLVNSLCLRVKLTFIIWMLLPLFFVKYASLNFCMRKFCCEHLISVYYSSRYKNSFYSHTFVSMNKKHALTHTHMHMNNHARAHTLTYTRARSCLQVFYFAHFFMYTRLCAKRKIALNKFQPRFIKS